LRLGLLIIVSVYHDGNSPVSNEPTGPIPRVHFKQRGSPVVRLQSSFGRAGDMGGLFVSHVAARKGQ